MKQSRGRGRGSKVETEARPCEAEVRPSQLKKNCLEPASRFIATKRKRDIGDDDDDDDGLHAKSRKR